MKRCCYKWYSAWISADMKHEEGYCGFEDYFKYCPECSSELKDERKRTKKSKKAL